MQQALEQQRLAFLERATIITNSVIENLLDSLRKPLRRLFLARWLVPKLKRLLLEMGSRILRTNQHKEGESPRDRMNTRPLKPSSKTLT
jgi:hypothetical protein